jgi:hypothetical protein
VRKPLPGCALVMLTLAVSGAPPCVAQVSGDSATGSGTTALETFNLDAHSGPSGENPYGYARRGLSLSPVIEVKGPVTCLTVTGNRAVIGIENSGYFAGPPSFFRGAFIEVVDGGTSDYLGTPTLLAEPPTTCPAGPQSFYDPVVTGNIVVIDAPPFPTSSKQCKDGGWRNFGSAFTNQGDCVSFVASKGKP